MYVRPAEASKVLHVVATPGSAGAVALSIE